MLGNRRPYNKQFCTFFVGGSGVAGDVEYKISQQPLKLFSTFQLTMRTEETRARYEIWHKCRS